MAVSKTIAMPMAMPPDYLKRYLNIKYPVNMEPESQFRGIQFALIGAILAFSNGTIRFIPREEYEIWFNVEGSDYRLTYLPICGCFELASRDERKFRKCFDVNTTFQEIITVFRNL